MFVWLKVLLERFLTSLRSPVGPLKFRYEIMNWICLINNNQILSFKQVFDRLLKKINHDIKLFWRSVCWQRQTDVLLTATIYFHSDVEKLKNLCLLVFYSLQLSKKYGPVFTVHLGPKKTVVLAGYKTIKQALLNVDAFSDKEVLPIISDLKLTHGEWKKCVSVSVYWGFFLIFAFSLIL